MRERGRRLRGARTGSGLKGSARKRRGGRRPARSPRRAPSPVHLLPSTHGWPDAGSPAWPAAWRPARAKARRRARRAQRRRSIFVVTRSAKENALFACTLLFSSVPSQTSLFPPTMHATHATRGLATAAMPTRANRYERKERMAERVRRDGTRARLGLRTPLRPRGRASSPSPRPGGCWRRLALARDPLVYPGT